MTSIVSSTSPFAALRASTGGAANEWNRSAAAATDEKFGGFSLFAFDSGVRTRSATSALRSRVRPSSSPRRGSSCRVCGVAHAGRGDAETSSSASPRASNRSARSSAGCTAPSSTRTGGSAICVMGDSDSGRTGKSSFARSRAPAPRPWLASTLSTDAQVWMARHFSRVSLFSDASAETRAPPVRPSSRSPARIAPDFSAFAAASRLAERALRSRRRRSPASRARDTRWGVAAFSSSAIAASEAPVAGGKRATPASCEAARCRARVPSLTKESSIATTALRGGDAFECVVLPPRAQWVSRCALGRAVRAGCENIQTRRLGRRRVARRGCSSCIRVWKVKLATLAQRNVNRKATDTRRRGHTPPARQRLLTARWARRFRSPTIPRPPRARAARRRRAPPAASCTSSRARRTRFSTRTSRPSSSTTATTNRRSGYSTYVFSSRSAGRVRRMPLLFTPRGARSRGGAPRARRAPRPSRRAYENLRPP